MAVFNAAWELQNGFARHLARAKTQGFKPVTFTQWINLRNEMGATEFDLACYG